MDKQIAIFILKSIDYEYTDKRLEKWYGHRAPYYKAALWNPTHLWSRLWKDYGEEIKFMDPIGIGANLSYHLAAFAEGICSLFIILGLYTRIAAIILLINFIVIFTFHAFIIGDGFSVLELRYFYLFTILALFFSGPGKYSLDHMLLKSNKNKK